MTSFIKKLQISRNWNFAYIVDLLATAGASAWMGLSVYNEEPFQAIVASVLMIVLAVFGIYCVNKSSQAEKEIFDELLTSAQEHYERKGKE